MIRTVAAIGAAMTLAGCGAPKAAGESQPAARIAPPAGAVYEGIETRLLADDLVSFSVRMRGARDRADVEAYAECAAAQYTLIRGYGFARHVRTNVDEQGGLWRADAVYTVSAALPDGLARIDAEVVAAHCAENAIPMV